MGITTNPKKRWEANGYNYFDHPIFYAVIKKFGWNNIKHVIAFTCKNKQLARVKEMKIANHYQYYGLSLNAGNGQSHTPSLENRQKISEMRKNYIMSEETKRKIGEASKKRVGTKYFKHRLETKEDSV